MRFVGDGWQLAFAIGLVMPDNGRWLKRLRAHAPARRKGSCMDLAYGCLACTGDNSLPFIVGGVVVAALAVLVVAFVLMRRK
ncbi:hypothetical protein DMP08_09145 [Paraeggerthella hongkongensis]|uniref:Uncharacterized protein n=1 Tax=Paraeggerthella hongkongensis TaxID=230658 RepID=A0A3N0B3A2_9ACTN|nr:hypothetical protein DMP08_09145 [Paraeggerthella hongkongensis]